MSVGGRSPLGIQLDRAERYSIGSDGKRIKPISSKDFEGTRVKETRRHALSRGVDASQEEELVREGMRARIEASLEPDEIAVLRLQGKLTVLREVRLRIPAGDVEEYTAREGGFTFIPGSEQVEERPGLPPITTVEVVGKVEEQVEGLDRADVAERLGKTFDQVRRLISSANRKLRALERGRR